MKRQILILALILVLLVFGGTLWFTNAFNHSRIDNLYVENAQLSGPAISEYIGAPFCFHALAGIHRLEKGRGLVIVRHKMIDPNVFMVDDEWYEFFSVALPANMVNKMVRIPSPGIEVAYSRGGRHWFSTCNGEVGIDFQGKISTHNDGKDNLSVSLDIAVTGASTDSTQTKHPLHIKENFVAKPTTLSKLQDLIPADFRFIEELSKRERNRTKEN